MFVATGSSAARFCDWVGRLGEQARVLGDPRVESLAGELTLLHLEAETLLATPAAASLRACLDAARARGALISIELGAPSWIRAHGSSRIAYQLATIRPDVLFAGEAAAAELAAPLEGIASVPVLKLDAGGCAVYGRRLVAPAEIEPDEIALAAAFCVAYAEGAAPVEAAGRAVLVAAMRAAL